MITRNVKIDEGFLLPEETNGIIGELGFYIPLHLAEKDWSMTSFRGLANNRTKMAETFGRPTNWLEYCTKIPNVTCNEENDIASRIPETADEESSYFKEGVFKGYFQNDDCIANPDTCVGYFVNLSGMVVPADAAHGIK